MKINMKKVKKKHLNYYLILVIQLQIYIQLLNKPMYSDGIESLVIKLPKTFADESKKRGPNYYDYQNIVNLIWSDGSIYVCQRKIGRGKYSQVFQGLNTNNSQKCVVKMLKPIKFKKINRQIKVLMALNGQENVIKLLDIVKQGDIYCLVFQHVQTIEYKTLLQNLTPHDSKYYLYQVLKGLHYCHSMGIMHRDIKPQNLAINHEKKTLRILDWGLSQFYLPKKDYNVRVCSRYFKGPELLVRYEYYHYSLDIWSLSVVMAGMIFQKEPFFKGADDFDQLQQITKILGTQQLYDYINKYKIVISVELQRALGSHKGIKFSSLVNEKNSHLATPDAIDLLQKMMVYDHNERLTALECMNHPFFDDVRQTRHQISEK